MKRLNLLIAGIALTALIASCKKDKSSPSSSTPQPLNQKTAPVVSVDRFSSAAGTLQVRTATNGLPAANAPVSFDVPPFITVGYGPTGQVVQYYNFDVQSTTPAPIYMLYWEGDTTAVAGQANIIDVLPGTAGYNDFWQIHKVTVPTSYVANTVTSYQQLVAAGYTITPTTTLVNCPVVPAGSTANKQYGSSSPSSLVQGWYKDSVVYYFSFLESPLATTSTGLVPTAPIWVTFNINPGNSGGGPPSGFMEVSGTMQTHNVISVLPGVAGYSPLWGVSIYNNSAFASVSNSSTAQAAPTIGPGPNVNCPVVVVE